MDSNESDENMVNRERTNEQKILENEAGTSKTQNNSDINSISSDQVPSISSVRNGPVAKKINSYSLNENDRSAHSHILEASAASKFTNGSNEISCEQSSSTSDVKNKTDVAQLDGEEIELMNIEKPSCQRYKPCHDKASAKSYNYNVPSTSNMHLASDNIKDYSDFKDSTKRPSSLRLSSSNVQGPDDSSSDTGNDDYSLGSEDGCIYTYRGGEHLADLPSSFFSLDMGLSLDKHLPVPPCYGVRQDGGLNNNPGQVSRASSPDMDFLEMDFDPGPSCEADTGDKTSPEERSDVSEQMPDETPPPANQEPAMLESNSPADQVPVEVETHKDPIKDYDHYTNAVPSTSREGQCNEKQIPEENSTIYGSHITHVNFRGERLIVRRTTGSCTAFQTLNLHTSGGDVISLNKKEESEAMWSTSQSDQKDRSIMNNSNLASVLYHQTMAKKLIVEKAKEDFIDGVDSSNLSCEAESWSEAEDSGAMEVTRNMLWSEQEACELQVVQNGASTCGIVAVKNAFLALGIPVDAEKIKSTVSIRQRHNDAPLVRYLLSRSVAGCTAADLVSGIQRASDGLATARFFPMYPEKAMSLSHWLADWISVGAVPIATLNLQAGCDGDVPDAWHHQMIFGVSARGVFLCNPVECVPEAALWPRLTSPSTLLVRTRDILSRFAPSTDLTPLMYVPDERFHTYNVLGQVVNALREWRAAGWSEERMRSRHVRVPAAYVAGVTVAALVGSEAHWRLTHAPPLPALRPHAKHDG